MLNKEFQNTVDLLLKVAAEGQKATASFRTQNSIKSFQQFESTAKSAVSGVSSAYRNLNEAQQAHLKALQNQQRASLNVATAERAEAVETAKLTLQRQELIKAAKRQAMEELGLISAYDRVVAKMNEAGKAVQNLTARKLAGERLSDKEQKELKESTREFQRYQQAVIGADASIGRYQRNVGNYPKGLQAAAGAARNLASAMGLLGGAFLAVRVVGNAFNRIREFDKEMQNMAGILRSTRPELKEIEQRIIAVAGSSIRTSNEVAKLATSLLTLGKTKDEVLLLLEPVNNLSIALGATSEEAGEFLVQTLNSFGASAESAAEYADVIATIRSSTSLDFQKMRDSFQYLSPISRLLGKDLAYTGAIIGILADNGLKAESAGRLLATAEQRLAKSGKTLQDGLDEINDAYREGKTEIEILALASKLFGAQAAKVGAILATNTDKIDKNADAIRKNGGALDDLVNQQLESLDAKLKILDSSWEKFILSIENGEGAISNFFKGTAEFLSQTLEGWALLNKSAQEYNETLASDITDNYYKQTKKAYKEMGEDAQKLAIIEADAAREKVDEITKEINRLNAESIKATESAIGLGVSFTEAWNKSIVEDLSKDLGYYNGVLKASEEIIGFVDESLKNKNDTEDEAAEKQVRSIEYLRELIKLERERLESLDLEDEDEVSEVPSILANIAAYEKEIEAILGTNKARKQRNDYLKGSLAYYDAEISKLQNQQKNLARNSKEWQKYQIKIDAAKKAQQDFILLVNGYSISFYESLISDLEAEQKQVASNGREWQVYQDRIDATKKSLQDLIVEIKGVNEGVKSIDDFASAWKNLQDIISDTDFGKIDGLNYDKLNNDLEEFSKNFEKQQQTLVDIQVRYAQMRNDIESELSENLVELGQSVVDAIFQSQLQSIENEMSVLEKRTELALQFAGDNAAAQEEIKRQSLEKQEELEKKRIETEKKAFLFQQAFKLGEIAIDTIQKVAALKAQAAVLAANPVTAALASIPLGLIPIVITTGAVAGAAVLAQSIPAFEDGGTSPGGDILVNDAKRSNFKEVVVTPKGDVLRPQKRNTVIAPPKGSQIFKSERDFMQQLRQLTSTHNIMFDSDLLRVPEISPTVNVNGGLSKEDFNSGIKSLKDSIGNSKGAQVIFDENGFRKFLSSGDGRTEILNNRFVFKSKSV